MLPRWQTLADVRLPLICVSNPVRVADQCTIGGPGVPSDHSSAKTKKVVTRCSGSYADITGEPGRLAPQLFSASPEAKNITCGCQLLPSSFRYCCFDIM